LQFLLAIDPAQEWAILIVVIEGLKNGGIDGLKD
jgi:hypothetical protein